MIRGSHGERFLRRGGSAITNPRQIKTANLPWLQAGAIILQAELIRMATVPNAMPTWKRLLLISMGLGAGIALALSAILGTFVWYQSRPKPARPWNTSAVIAKEPPRFGKRDDSHVTLSYVLENVTDSDYKVESSGEIKTMLKLNDGSLVGPVVAETATLDLPVFIPAHQRATVSVYLDVNGPLPQKSPQETSDQYHERLRSYLQEHSSGLGGFALFDDGNRYRIDLPRWLSEPPK